MTEGIVTVFVLFVIGGGGIIVIDAFIIRKLRQARDARRDDS